jgi:plastocyanin
MLKYPCLVLLAMLSIAGAMPARAQNKVWFGDDCVDALLCFSPNPLTIRVGESVTFTLYCEFFCREPHNVVADDGSFRCANGCDGEGGDGTPASDPPGWTFTRTFSVPGLVRIHDEVSHVSGLIIVSPGPIGTVTEFYNPDLGQYFMTADPAEQAYVDTGAVGNWHRTGESFPSGGSVAVCRFGGNPLIDPATRRPRGPNSHFYTADSNECAGLIGLYVWNMPGWHFESYDFTTTPPDAGGCAAGLTPVYRAYNDGFARGVDSNHRFTTNLATYEAMIAAGWIGEGVHMCAPQ